MKVLMIRLPSFFIFCIMWQLISAICNSFGLIFGQSGSGKTTLLQVIRFIPLVYVSFRLMVVIAHEMALHFSI